MSLIQELPNCPLDIIGDVHGQLEALQNLLHYLGYTPTGKHPQGRKIVFVGDLVDRGPDSPAVLEWYKQAHQAGNAYMVLGNHELNLLMNEPKRRFRLVFQLPRRKRQPQLRPVANAA